MRARLTSASAALLLATAGPAAAAPLEPEACAALKSEREQLIAAGAKVDMQKGPEWAKENLAPERLGRIERLIAVEEQLSFRCDVLVTARPALKEPPKPAQPGKEAAATADRSGTASDIPLPKKKKQK